MFEKIVDDALDQTLEVQLLNAAKDMLENERDWQYLKKLDTSQVFNSGDTFLTTHPLPSDFVRPSSYGIFIGLNQTTQVDMIPYQLIPYEQAIRWQAITHRYYIDMNNLVYGIMGSANPGGTIYFYYQKFTPPLAPATGSQPSGTVNTPSMPKRFIPLLVYYMGMQYFAVDQGDKNRAWDDRWQKYFSDLHDAMVLWDEMLVTQARQNAYMPIDLSAYPTILDVDSL
jgi:hypothetical protein